MASANTYQLKDASTATPQVDPHGWFSSSGHKLLDEPSYSLFPPRVVDPCLPNSVASFQVLTMFIAFATRRKPPPISLLYRQ
jgi:hypothetical protein